MSDKIVKQAKNNIYSLINMGEVEKASVILNKLESAGLLDSDIFVYKGIVQLISGNMDLAKKSFFEALNIDGNCVDALYNIGYIYQLEHEYFMALKYLKMALYTSDFNNYQLNAKSDIEIDVKTIIELIQENSQDSEFNEDLKEVYSHSGIRKKIVVFVKVGMDSFVDDVVNHLSIRNEVKVCRVNQISDMTDFVEWADVCWFEWCDDLIIYASTNSTFKSKNIVCRIHSYEVFTNYINEVEWSSVNHLVFVASHIRDIFNTKVVLSNTKTHIIPNSVDLNRWKYKKRNLGKNIAYVGYINYKKGPMLLIQSIKELLKQDMEAVFHIAGQFQDQRDVLYFEQMVNYFDLNKRVIFYGWIDDLDSWLENKDYIICTSILESQNMSVMQAMTKGIKPLIHNFVGAMDIYPSSLIWNDIDELLNLYKEQKYESFSYRSFVLENYSRNIIGSRYNKLLNQLESDIDICRQDSDPLISVLITSYNYDKYIEKSISSVLTQTYSNLELVIVDDLSTDNSRVLISNFKDKRIRVINNKKNRGYFYAISNFLRNWASGEYVYILSADDMLASSTTIEDLYKTISKKNLDLVYGNQIIIDSLENNIGYSKFSDISTEQVVTETLIRFGSGVIPILFGLFKREFFTKNNFFWDEYKGCSNDTLNTLMAVGKGLKYAYFDIDVIKYRIHESNFTYNIKSRVRDVFSICEYIFSNHDVSKFLQVGNYNGNPSGYETYIRFKYYVRFIKYYMDDYTPFGNKKILITVKDRVSALNLVLEKVNGLYFDLKDLCDYNTLQEIDKEYNSILKMMEI